MFNTKLLYNFFYVFFEKKLRVLQNYLHNNLALNKIRHLINCVEVFVMFVTKKK